MAKIEITRMITDPVRKDKSLLAFFDFTMGGLLFRDWVLREGKKGNFISSPSKFVEAKKRGDDDFYVRYVDIADKGEDEDGQALIETILEAAEEAYDDGGVESKKKSKGSKKRRRDEDDDEDEDEEEEERPRKKKAAKGKKDTKAAKKSGRGPAKDDDDAEDDEDEDDDLPF